MILARGVRVSRWFMVMIFDSARARSDRTILKDRAGGCRACPRRGCAERQRTASGGKYSTPRPKKGLAASLGAGYNKPSQTPVPMAKLVFDIETSALPLERFDEAQQEYLFRDCEKITDETARAARHAEIQQQFNLWPFTAQVVCIAMLNADTSRGQVLFYRGRLRGRRGRSRAGRICALRR